MTSLILADDSPTIQKVVELSFANEEVEIHYFGEGRSALEFVRQKPVDLLLADVSLPLLNGYELCRRIKQNPETTHLPVILLGSALEPYDAKRGEEAGCDAGLTKPLTPTQLVELVNSLLPTSDVPGGAVPLESMLEQVSPEVAESFFAPAARVSGKVLFSLRPSQCQATAAPYVREIFRDREIETKAPNESMTDEYLLGCEETQGDEIDFLVDQMAERLVLRLRDLLPDIAREILKNRK